MTKMTVKGRYEEGVKKVEGSGVYQGVYVVVWCSSLYEASFPCHRCHSVMQPCKINDLTHYSASCDCHACHPVS